MAVDLMNFPYKGGITREQFLFFEMRTTARLKLNGMSDDEVVSEIINNNLFEYPTNKMIKNIARVCVARINHLDSLDLVDLIANGSGDQAKQVCLYAMIVHYRLVWDFMITVVGEKFRMQDLSWSKKDVNVFFSRLQEQNETVASWSDSTVAKLKQVLVKLLVDNEYLDSTRSDHLNQIWVDPTLKDVIEEQGNAACLIAFNCFGG